MSQNVWIAETRNVELTSQCLNEWLIGKLIPQQMDETQRSKPVKPFVDPAQSLLSCWVMIPRLLHK